MLHVRKEGIHVKMATALDNKFVKKEHTFRPAVKKVGQLKINWDEIFNCLVYFRLKGQTQSGKNPYLRSNHQLVLTGLSDPLQVVL